MSVKLFGIEFTNEAARDRALLEFPSSNAATDADSCGGMMFERFTDRARRVTALAQEEARAFNHNYIGTQHFLGAMLLEGDEHKRGAAGMTLEKLGITIEDVRIRMPKAGEAKVTGHIPFTPQAKKLMALSLKESLQLGNNYIGTEHLLLALLRDPESKGAQILGSLADLPRVRKQVIVLLSGEQRVLTDAQKLVAVRQWVSAIRRACDHIDALVFKEEE